MRSFRSIFFCILFLQQTATLVAAQRPIIIESMFSEDVSAETAELLKRNDLKINFVSRHESRAILDFAHALNGLAEAMELPGDVPGKTIIGIQDSMIGTVFSTDFHHPNAWLIVLSRGFLEFLNSDDELALVLAAELDARSAELKKRAQDSLYFLKKERAGPNPQSVVQRMRQAGLNPYAGFELTRRAGSGSDWASRVLTGSLSSIDQSLGTVLTVLRRSGERLDPQEKRSRVLTSPLVDGYLRAKPFRDRRLAILRSSLAKDRSRELESYYAYVREPKEEVTSEYLSRYQVELYYNQRSLAQNLLGRWLTPELERSLEVEFSNSLRASLDAARARALGEEFQPANFDQLKAWAALERPWAGGHASSLVHNHELMEKLGQEHSHDQLAANDRGTALKTARENFEKARHFFPASAQIEDLLVAILAAKKDPASRERLFRQLVALESGRGAWLAEFMDFAGRQYERLWDTVVMASLGSKALDARLDQVRIDAPFLISKHLASINEAIIEAVAIDTAEGRFYQSAKLLEPAEKDSTPRKPQDLNWIFQESLKSKPDGGVAQAKALLLKAVDRAPSSQTIVFILQEGPKIFGKLVFEKAIQGEVNSKMIERVIALGPDRSPEGEAQRTTYRVPVSHSGQAALFLDSFFSLLGKLASRQGAASVPQIPSEKLDLWVRIFQRFSRDAEDIELSTGAMKAYFIARYPEVRRFARADWVFPRLIVREGLLEVAAKLEERPDRAKIDQMGDDRQQKYLLRRSLRLELLREYLFPEGFTDEAGEFLFRLEQLLRFGENLRYYKLSRPEFMGKHADRIAFLKWVARRHPEAIALLDLLQWGERFSHDSAIIPVSDNRAEKDVADAVVVGFGHAFLGVYGRTDPAQSQAKRLVAAGQEFKDTLLSASYLTHGAVLDGVFRAIRTLPGSHWENFMAVATGFSNTRGYRKLEPSLDQSMYFLAFEQHILLELIPAAIEEIKRARVPDPAHYRLALFLMQNLGARREVDALYERLVQKAGMNALPMEFRDEKRVEQLFFSENRYRLALWQLERNFAVASEASALKRRAASPPEAGAVRGFIEALAQMIGKQFPKASGARQRVLSHVATQLQLNEAELRHLKPLFSDAQDWATMADPQEAGVAEWMSHLHNSPNRDRLAILRYLLAIDSAIPNAILAENKATNERLEDPTKMDRYLKAVTGFRDRLALLSPIARAYHLQAFLDERVGLLSQPAYENEILDLVLAGESGNKPLRALLETYLRALPPGEKRALLGHVLANIADSSGGVRRPVVRPFLEAMGPLGIKAAQFLRASGLAEGELREELEHFFDKAFPPERHEIFERLREVFEEDGFRRIKRVRGLLGSGSINYVVLADMENAETGVVELVAIRLLRKSTENRIENEASIWDKWIKLLTGHGDEGVKGLARVMREAYDSALKTLAPGGAELDQEHERNAQGMAERAYGSFSAKDPTTGFSIDVARWIPGFQELVRPSRAREASVYRFVDFVPLGEVSDAKLREALAVQIARAEWRALFELFIFDADGHPGNWLVDVKNKRLVRIDYAKIGRADPIEMDAFKRALRLLLNPRLGQAKAHALAKEIHAIFDAGPIELGMLGFVVSEILEEAGMPEFSSPHLRMLYLRQRLEAKLNHPVRFNPDIARALESMARVHSYDATIGRLKYSLAFVQAIQVSSARAGMHWLTDQAHSVLKRCQRLLLGF